MSRSRVSVRKWRLVMAAVVRDARRHHLLPAVADAVSLAERMADGLVDDLALAPARAVLGRVWTDSELPLLLQPDPAQPQAAGNLALAVVTRLWNATDDPGRLADIIREVIGNPFRWVRWDDDWLTPTVHTLAADAYARGQFDGLPILADAVEDAGCDNPELLEHLRGKGPHARGCWALDVILGKV